MSLVSHKSVSDTVMAVCISKEVIDLKAFDYQDENIIIIALMKVRKDIASRFRQK